MASTDPFASKGSGDSGGSIQDYENQLVLIWPREHIAEFKTKRGDVKDPIRADWVVLDGEDAGELEEDRLIFGAFLIGDLKKLAKKNYRVNDDQGDADRSELRPFLGRLWHDPVPVKGNMPWRFKEATDADKALAIKWLDDNKPEEKDPFD